MKPTFGNTSSTWKAWTGFAPDGALALSHFPTGYVMPSQCRGLLGVSSCGAVHDRRVFM